MISGIGAALVAFGIFGAVFTLLALWADRIGPALEVAKRRRIYRRMRRS